MLWTVPQLQPGEKRVLKVTTLGKQAGKGLIQSATASAGPEVTAVAQTKLDILPLPGSPKLEVSGFGNPVAVGKTVTYQIRVSNQGQEPLNQVQVRAVLPRELKIVKVLPPDGWKEMRTGQTIDFSGKDFLEETPLEYRIEAEGVVPGKGIFHVELRVQGKPPIIREEPTTVFLDAPMK